MTTTLWLTWTWTTIWTGDRTWGRTRSQSSRAGGWRCSLERIRATTNQFNGVKTPPPRMRSHLRQNNATKTDVSRSLQQRGTTRFTRTTSLGRGSKRTTMMATWSGTAKDQRSFLPTSRALLVTSITLKVIAAALRGPTGAWCRMKKWAYTGDNNSKRMTKLSS